MSTAFRRENNFQIHFIILSVISNPCAELRVTDGDTIYRVNLSDHSVADMGVSPSGSFNPYGIDIDHRLGLMFVISGTLLYMGNVEGSGGMQQLFDLNDVNGE